MALQNLENARKDRLQEQIYQQRLTGEMKREVEESANYIRNNAAELSGQLASIKDLGVYLDIKTQLLLADARRAPVTPLLRQLGFYEAQCISEIQHAFYSFYKMAVMYSQYH